MGDVNKTIVYGVRIKDSGILKKSTSGGIFTALSDRIIEDGGVVCGAVFTSDYEVKHVVSNSKKTRDNMRGAKYVQSNMKDAIPDIIKSLENKYTVLFTGTPCEVSAIKKIAAIKKLDKRLITVDIICHGVPSPNLFKEHISMITKKYGTVKAYIFRDKKKGWRGQNVTVITERGFVPDEDAKLFSLLYFNSLIIRPSCHNCKFASIKREGDITIGDFWGISHENTAYDDNVGISQVIINTEKGKQLFDKVKKDIEFFEVMSDSYIQPNMIEPTHRSIVADTFWKTYKRKGIEGGKKILRTLKYRMIPYRIWNKICRIRIKL